MEAGFALGGLPFGDLGFERIQAALDQCADCFGFKVDLVREAEFSDAMLDFWRD